MQHSRPENIKTSLGAGEAGKVTGTKGNNIPENTKGTGLNRRLDLKPGKYLNFCGDLCYVMESRFALGGNIYRLKFLGKRTNKISDGWFKENYLRQNNVSNVECYTV